MTTGNVPRPGRYPYHAESLTVTLPTVSEGAGYTSGTIANPSTANALGQSAGRWFQQIDLAKVAVDDLIASALPYLVRGLSLTYPLASGLANLEPTQTPVVVTDGCRIAFDETVLEVAGLYPVTFTASSRIWFYGTPPAGPGEYPSVRSETVALATASNPLSGEIVLGGVDTDATHVTANLASDLSDVVPIDVPISIAADLTVTVGDVWIDNALTVGGSATLNGLTVDGNTQLGEDAANTLTVNATATFTSPVIASAAATFNGASFDITGADLDMNSNAVTGVARLVLDTGVLPINAGQLTAGASGVLRYQPAGTAHYVHTTERGFLRGWSAAASGTEPAAGGNDIAEVTVTPGTTGDVLVTCTGSITFDSDSQVVLVTLIDTTSGVTLATQNERAPDVDAGANQTRSFVIRGIRTLPDTAARTFAVRFGAGADVIYANVITSVDGID